MTEEIRWLNENCSTCNAQMNSWDMKLTRKFKVRNTCERCFCEIYDLSEYSFRKTMEDYFGMRPCQSI